MHPSTGTFSLKNISLKLTRTNIVCEDAKINDKIHRRIIKNHLIYKIFLQFKRTKLTKMFKIINRTFHTLPAILVRKCTKYTLKIYIAKISYHYFLMIKLKNINSWNYFHDAFTPLLCCQLYIQVPKRWLRTNVQLYTRFAQICTL